MKTPQTNHSVAMNRLAGGCRRSWLHLSAQSANRDQLEVRQPHRHTHQRQQASFVVKAAEAGSSTEVAASSSRTALGEDSAAFDSKQQSSQSWILFTGLLLGVLGLIYVVRNWARHCTTWAQLLNHTCTSLSCSCMCRPLLHILCCSNLQGPHSSAVTVAISRGGKHPATSFQQQLLFLRQLTLCSCICRHG